MTSKILVLTSLLGLFFSFTSTNADDLCTYQRYSLLHGSVVETYRDSNCYAAERYCEEDAAAAPADADAGGYSQKCKKPDERITSATKSYTLYHRGIRQGTFGATRYEVGTGAEYNAGYAASNKCYRERTARANASVDSFEYTMNSTCDSND